VVTAVANRVVEDSVVKDCVVVVDHWVVKEHLIDNCVVDDSIV